MGFDDAVADSGIIELIEKHIESFVDYYDEELTEEKLEEYEKTRCYTGYSLSFHTLYPLYSVVYFDGFFSHKRTPDEEKKIKTYYQIKIN